MLSRSNLEILKAAALRNDWRRANDAYLEVVLEAKELGESPHILDPLTWALRLQKGKNVAAIVDEMLGDDRRSPQQAK